MTLSRYLNLVRNDLSIPPHHLVQMEERRSDFAGFDEFRQEFRQAGLDVVFLVRTLDD